MSKYFLRQTDSHLKFKQSRAKVSTFNRRIQSAKKKFKKFHFVATSPGEQTEISSDTENSSVLLDYCKTLVPVPLNQSSNPTMSQTVLETTEVQTRLDQPLDDEKQRADGPHLDVSGTSGIPNLGPPLQTRTGDGSLSGDVYRTGDPETNSGGYEGMKADVVSQTVPQLGNDNLSDHRLTSTPSDYPSLKQSDLRLDCTQNLI